MTFLQNDTLLRALRREPTSYTPVWLMRQAGRYLPEYNATRKRAGSFMQLCTSPDLATEVTLQPLARFPLDAAILFSDILTVPDAMGLGLHFAEGEGPRFREPLVDEAAIQRLTAPDLSALGSALRSHPCVALSSAQAIPSLSNSGIPPSTRLCCLRFSSPLRIIQRPCLQHRHQHRQPSVRYSPCRPPVTMAGLAQRRIMLLRCGILLHARARPVIQRVPQPHIAAITHTHHLFLAALPRYWRYAPIAPQPVVISFPERS